LNPRPWVPEASMLTTRPPKPSINGLERHRYNTDGFSVWVWKELFWIGSEFDDCLIYTP
jgi:hypothetical protein